MAKSPTEFEVTLIDTDGEAFRLSTPTRQRQTKRELVESLLKWFVSDVENGRTLDAHLLRAVVSNVAKPLLKGMHPFSEPNTGRPARDFAGYDAQIAYIAAYLDPAFRKLPKSKGGRFASVADAIGCTENTVRNRLKNAYASERGLSAYADAYANTETVRLRGITGNDVRQWIAEFFAQDARPK